MTSIRNLFTRIGEFLADLRSAAAASEAIQSGRRPQARDLARLGIDARAFAAICRS